MPTATFPKYQGGFHNGPAFLTLVGAIVTAASPTRLKGKGYTVTKPGVGVFRITFNQKVVTVMKATGILRKAAGAATFLSGPPYVAGDNFVEYRVENAAGAATDPGTSDVIEFDIVVATTKLSAV